jgi:trk system potassium uptake protein TrkH
MFIVGSPGSTAGGIKTVTFAIVIMSAITTLRQRSEVELFKRSVRPDVVARATMFMMIYLFILITGILLLSITERNHPFSLMDISFEATSAIGTVGLSTGITSSLTNAGKLIIIILMLLGRLGMLTLIASLTFGAKPARFNYPAEGVMIG